MVWPAVIAAVGAIAGAAMSNRANRREAERNRQFQADMSNTSYQRGMADMRAAGLNPILAYTQGGASTPSGAQAAPNQSELGAGVSGALQGMQMIQGVQQVQQSEAQTKLIMDQAAKVRSETMAHDLNTARLAAQISQTKASTMKTEEEAILQRFNAATASQVYRNMLADPTAPENPNTGFAADVRRRKAEARLAELDIPRAEGQAKFEEKLGSTHQFVRFILEALRGMNFPGRR